MRHGVGATLFAISIWRLAISGRADRRAEQVLAFVQGVGAEHREHEIAHELFAQVVDEDLLHAELACHARRCEFLALADVGGEGHDLAVVSLLQPREDDGGVETAGICQNDFLDFGHGCDD